MDTIESSEREYGLTDGSKISRIANDHLHEGIVSLFLKQAWTEAALSWRKRVHFRRIKNAEAVNAYCAMTPAEFEDINARQKWSNWRTIPRNIYGRLAGPSRAVDLCSGVGHSTEVLAYYLPRGSEILGLEYNPEFVRAAAAREYCGAGGETVPVAFRAQSVLETFHDGVGEPLKSGSVDLVNSCGSLGIHFDAPELERLLDEVSRVLKPGGLASVDSGTEGIGEQQMIDLFAKRRFRVLSRAKSCFLDRFTQICFRKA